MRWSDAASLPLCLLTPNTQNRRIITAAFRRAKAQSNVIIETDSIFALYSHVLCAEVFSVVPHSMLCLLDMRHDLTAIPPPPEFTREIGLLALDHDPLPPFVSAARKITETLDVKVPQIARRRNRPSVFTK